MFARRRYPAIVKHKRIHLLPGSMLAVPYLHLRRDPERFRDLCPVILRSKPQINLLQPQHAPDADHNRSIPIMPDEGEYRLAGFGLNDELGHADLSAFVSVMSGGANRSAKRFKLIAIDIGIQALSPIRDPGSNSLQISSQIS
jgi:hypothetical protein